VRTRIERDLVFVAFVTAGLLALSLLAWLVNIFLDLFW